jgi:hypothetical protein
MLRVLIWLGLQGEARKEFIALRLREYIIGCLALIEALINFGEGEEIEEGVFDEGTSVSLLGGRIVSSILLTIYTQRSDERDI